MKLMTTFAVLTLLTCSGMAYGSDDRWNNFAEDGDLKYYLDQKSVVQYQDGVYLFWVKSVARRKDYFKREYNLNNLSYILTNYEMDCMLSAYRVRGAIMFDKNRRELNKSVSNPAVTPFEPVAPESVLELAQDEICAKEESADLPDTEELSTDLPVEVVVPLAAITLDEPPSIQ